MSNLPAKQPDWERYLALGIKHAREHFSRVYAGPNLDRQRKAYAAGFATGLARWITSHYGEEFAFDLLSGLADEAIEPKLPQGD